MMYEIFAVMWNGFVQIRETLTLGCDWTIATVPESGKRLPEDDGPFVMLVSGLELGRIDSSPLAAQLLIDFVAGRLGGPSDCEIASKISR